MSFAIGGLLEVGFRVFVQRARVVRACTSLRLKEKFQETAANMSYDKLNQMLKLGVLRKSLFVASYSVQCKNTSYMPVFVYNVTTGGAQELCNCV